MRPKRKSNVLETARQRLAGLKQIHPKPNFGTTLTEAAYEGEITGYATTRTLTTATWPRWMRNKTISTRASVSWLIGTSASWPRSRRSTALTAWSLNWSAASAAANARNQPAVRKDQATGKDQAMAQKLNH